MLRKISHGWINVYPPGKNPTKNAGGQYSSCSVALQLQQLLPVLGAVFWDRQRHPCTLWKELLLWLCCRPASCLLSGWANFRGFVLCWGVAAPMAADQGVRGAGSPEGKGCFSRSGCWPASVLTTAAARAVLYSQSFKQGFCHSTEIMTKKLSIDYRSLSCKPTGRPSGYILHLLRKHLWVPAALLFHISASLPQHTNKFRKQGCSGYVRNMGDAHRKISYLRVHGGCNCQDIFSGHGICTSAYCWGIQCHGCFCSQNSRHTTWRSLQYVLYRHKKYIN